MSSKDHKKKEKSEKKEPFIYRDPSIGASHKIPVLTVSAKEGETKIINIINCVAKESLTKCQGETKNTERIFIRGDTVDIIYITMDDFNLLDDAKAWFIVTKEKDNEVKKRIWARPIKILRENLNPVGEKKVYQSILEHGYARGKRGVSDNIKCSSVKIQDCFKIWIEDEEQEQKRDENPCTNTKAPPSFNFDGYYEDRENDEDEGNLADDYQDSFNFYPF